MLPDGTTYNLEEREKKYYEKERFIIPGQIGARGKYRILKRGLSQEDYKMLKSEDEYYLSMNGRHRYANFLPDDIRPKDVYVPVFDDEDPKSQDEK